MYIHVKKQKQLFCLLWLCAKKVHFLKSNFCYGVYTFLEQKSDTDCHVYWICWYVYMQYLIQVENYIKI